MGMPGWPDFAFWTASIASVRIVLMQSSSRSTCRVAIPQILRRANQNPKSELRTRIRQSFRTERRPSSRLIRAHPKHERLAGAQTLAERRIEEIRRRPVVVVQEEEAAEGAQLGPRLADRALVGPERGGPALDPEEGNVIGARAGRKLDRRAEAAAAAYARPRVAAVRGVPAAARAQLQLEVELGAALVGARFEVKVAAQIGDFIA